MSIVLDQADTFLARVKSLPAAPKVILPLLLALSDPETEMSRVVDMISVDPGLTARLLQMCNCAYLNKGSTVVCVSEAVSRLGFQTVYRAVALARLDSVMRPKAGSGLDAEELWKHSASVALAAQFIAQKARVPANTTFTAGLLHDIGKVVMADALRPDYGRLCEGGQAFGSELVDRERLRFNVEHAEIGARLLQRWNMPDELAIAVQFHHNPAEAGEYSRMAACLQLADCLAHQLTISPKNKGSEAPPVAIAAPAALSILNIRLEDISFYLEEIQEHLQFVEAICRMQG